MAQKIKKLKENQRKIRVFIISGGYGAIDALEPINDYEAVMKGKIVSVNISVDKAFDSDQISQDS